MPDHASTPAYRGRLAPTPTGLLHTGHARTFYIAWSRARAVGGKLIYRDEDLDPDRCKPEYSTGQMEDLRWLGLDWDEGPDRGGPSGPYRQSERRALYEETWERLWSGGFLFPCTCTRRELRDASLAPNEGSDEPLYPGTCRNRNLPTGQSPAESRRGVNWRFRVPNGRPMTFFDGRLGTTKAIAGETFGDFVVWRKDDVPAYQLAVVVDDHAMRITEIVRGEDLVVSTFRQILLYEALQLPIPAFYHTALVRRTDGKRLAKRDQILSLETLRKQGSRPSDILRGFG